MDRTVNLAIGSTCAKPGDLAGNLAQISSLAKRAADNRCDLLLTPELSATGYGSYPEVLELAERAGDGPVYRALADMAIGCHLQIAAGFVERGESLQPFIAHYLVNPDGSFLVQRKHRVTPAEYPLTPACALLPDDEGIGQVPPGQERLMTFNVKGVRTAILICADYGLDHLEQRLAAKGIELVLVPTGAGGKREDMVADCDLRTDQDIDRYIDLHAQANEYPRKFVGNCLRHRYALAAVNQCGYDGHKLYHSGSGVIISPYGVIEAIIAGMINLDHQHAQFACAHLAL